MGTGRKCPDDLRRFCPIFAGVLQTLENKAPILSDLAFLQIRQNLRDPIGPTPFGNSRSSPVPKISSYCSRSLQAGFAKLELAESSEELLLQRGLAFPLGLGRMSSSFLQRYQRTGAGRLCLSWAHDCSSSQASDQQIKDHPHPHIKTVHMA